MQLFLLDLFVDAKKPHLAVGLYALTISKAYSAGKKKTRSAFVVVVSPVTTSPT